MQFFVIISSMLLLVSATFVNEATAEVAREGSEIAAPAEHIAGIHSHAPAQNERGHSLAPAAHDILAPHSSENTGTGRGRVRSSGLTSLVDTEAERARVREAERELASALPQAAGRDPAAERALEDAVMEAAQRYPALRQALEAAGPEEDPVVAREQAARLDAEIAQVAAQEPALAQALQRVGIAEGDTPRVSDGPVFDFSPLRVGIFLSIMVPFTAAYVYLLLRPR